MLKKYYTLPFRADKIVKKEQHDSCELNDSIAQNLHLIISTYRGESAFAEDYGCSIWDEEFRTQLSIRWREDVKQSVLTAVEKFEPRLHLSDIKVDLVEHESRPDKKTLRVRRRVVLSITGIVKKTNEKFSFQKALFISPLSQL